ncbi:16S rRNA pseudouridine(516) synthase, partial [Xanthomonas citri pv. citri]|nr:16S rRNA pseudouridine(516) synthase [Xanthomonas citri pv. citri]
MRLDKFIAENTGLTRSQAARALKSGLVTINGK